MTTHPVRVQVVAVHVACRCCGDRTRIEHNHPDGFTRHVLVPLGSWWVAHRDPQLVLLEVTANGIPQEWAASNHLPNERPSP